MNAIVCVDKEWGIGKKNDLLFSLPLDMNFFRQTTKNKVVCMGYNTLMSFPNSKPLKNRVNIVLCDDGIEIENCICVHNLNQLFDKLKDYDSQEIFVIGGAMFYKTMLDYCENVYVTKVDAVGNAQLFFENLDNLPTWEVVKQSETFNDNGYDIKFVTYRNNKVKKY